MLSYVDKAGFAVAYANIPTERNYALSYWRKILQYKYHRLMQITQLVDGVKSYSTYVYQLSQIMPLVRFYASN